MAKAPKHHDTEFESTAHHEERKARIQEENVHNEQAARETAENQEIANFQGLPKDGETREQLLDRIRKLREEPPAPVEAPLYRSEGLQKAFEAEQEAGRAAVAKAQEAQDRMHTALAEVAGEKKAG